jgi:hypothetical protein
MKNLLPKMQVIPASPKTMEAKSIDSILSGCHSVSSKLNLGNSSSTGVFNLLSGSS